MNMTQILSIVLPNRSSLNCLLYADNLILISYLTRTGLQNVLPTLNCVVTG